MSLFDEITKATEHDYRKFILENPLLRTIMHGIVTKAHYVAYLRETYHLVRHTSRALSLAGARLTDDKRDLRNWFFEQVQEENGHDLFCIKDLRNIGEDPTVVLDGVPMAGAWGLITQNYYMATYGNPIGILGVATATEGLGADFGTNFSQILTTKFNLPSNAVTFLKSHGGFDVQHLEDARRRDVIHGRRMTFRFYGQLFLDVLSAVPATA
jgi:hypothetical protein